MNPDLMFLLGRRVTVANPNGSASWTGTLIAVTDGPSVVVDQDSGPRMTLPQRFTVTPADEPQPEPSQDARQFINSVITPDAGDLLKNLQAAKQTLRQEDLLAQLGNMLADLDGYVERRAAELAAPHIAEIGLAAGKDVAEAQASQQRAEDLVAELHRQYAVLERRRAKQQQRAEQAERERDELLAAVARVPVEIDRFGHEPHPSHDHLCPDDVRKSLLGALDKEEM